MPHALSPGLTKPLEPHLTDDSCLRSQSPQVMRVPLASWWASAWFSGEWYPDRTVNAKITPMQVASVTTTGLFPDVVGKTVFYIQFIREDSYWISGLTGGSTVMNQPAVQETRGSIPGSGRSPGEGIGNLHKCSCLENPMDRGAWRATVQGVAKSDRAWCLEQHCMLHPSPEWRPCVLPKHRSSPHKAVFLYFGAFC